MTMLADRPLQPALASSSTIDDSSDSVSAVGDAGVDRRASIGLGPLIALWLIVGMVIIALVLYMIEPLFQQREQGLLLERYAAEIDRASNQTSGLGGVEVSNYAPAVGAPVGIIETGAISLRQVIVEGTASSQTAKGPGHVPGTSGVGQPGNAVVVGRSGMYDGPFGRLSSMTAGDRIVISTTQGQSLYVVTAAGDVHLTASTSSWTAPEVPAVPVPTTIAAAAEPTASADDPAATTTSIDLTTTVVDGAEVDGSVDPTTPATTPPGDASEASDLDGRSIALSDLYGASKDDRLTLVTSASALPVNSADATVVIAVMVGKPFEPTAQNGRSMHDQGNGGDMSKWPLALLAIAFLAAAIFACVFLQRRSMPTVAYVLTVPPLIAFVVLASESIALLLPAWS